MAVPLSTGATISGGRPPVHRPGDAVGSLQLGPNPAAWPQLSEWKDNVESKGVRVSMNKTKVMISGERQKVRQKAVALWGLQ